MSGGVREGREGEKKELKDQKRPRGIKLGMRNNKRERERGRKCVGGRGERRSGREKGELDWEERE